MNLPPKPAGHLVNDLHSALNPTRVARILEPSGLAAIIALVREAAAAGATLSLCGGRHAMGGQQFGTGTWLVDLSRHAAVLAFDETNGLLTAEAGIQWPEIVAACHARHRAGILAWSIRQKQTGADRLSLGGSLSSNIHGRGLRQPPLVNDIEAFTLVDASGQPHVCSRSENQDLFRLAIGGYGLFGIVAEVTLRLAPRVKVERRVEVMMLEELVRVPAERDTTEWLYGDFQYSIDECSPDFLRRGVFSAYHRVADDLPVPDEQRSLSDRDWKHLIHLSHTDRARVFEEYAGYYLSTQGQRYWSDTHQLSTYPEHYHEELDLRLGATCPGSEMITELHVPRAALVSFMASAAVRLRSGNIPVIYGTIRLIERDTETFLAWAREPWACIIFNLHVDHDSTGIARARAAFQDLIDLALKEGGSFFLTYHRWARRDQIERAYPQFAAFLRAKDRHDPAHLFQSDWWRHHRALFIPD